MSARRDPHVEDRRLRIELLRLRAGYERLELARSIDDLRRELSLGSLVVSARSSLGTRGPAWLGAALRIARRVPWLPEVAAALLGTSRRRHIALKTALVAGLVWLGKHPPRL